jgi:hypothetical protein
MMRLSPVFLSPVFRFSGQLPSVDKFGYLEGVERQLLEWNGWTYNPGYGAWFPPGWFGD